jgi:hypothetical protein
MIPRHIPKYHGIFHDITRYSVISRYIPLYHDIFHYIKIYSIISRYIPHVFMKYTSIPYCLLVSLLSFLPALFPVNLYILEMVFLNLHILAVFFWGAAVSYKTTRRVTKCWLIFRVFMEVDANTIFLWYRAL